MVAILVKSSVEVGGSEKVFKFAKDRLESTDFRFDPRVRYQFWSVSFVTIPAMLYRTLTQQAMQRIHSVLNVKIARNLYFIATPIYVLTTFMAAFEGVTLFAYFFGKGCDIFQAGIVDNGILPFAVQELFHNQPGLTGLFTAALSSAALSTLSSCLSSLSAITYEDIIKVQFPQYDSYLATRLSKVILLIYGLLAMGITFAILDIPGSITVIFASFMGCMDGPMAAAFLISIMYRRATTKRVLIGIICGCAISYWLSIGKYFADVTPYPYLQSGLFDQWFIYGNKTLESIADEHTLSENSSHFSSTVASLSLSTIDPLVDNSSALHTLYSISYILYALIGFVTTSCISFIISLFTIQPHVVDEKCLFSFRKHVLEELCHFNLTNSAKTDNGERSCEMETEEGTKFLSTENAF